MQKRENESKKSEVRYVTITDEDAGRRVDNFLLNVFKNVPKSHIYRILRKGEVRVNKKRIDASYKLQEGDIVRLPPLFLGAQAKNAPPSESTVERLAQRILYEDDKLLIINKPSGMSVHAGNTVRVGVVEALRHLYPKLKNLELAHRLDSETSGCLVLAKKKRVLREIHQLLREGQVRKIYWALTKGEWKSKDLEVNLPLHKHYKHAGKHVVVVDDEGKQASTKFKTLKNYSHASLMEVALETGRTHQIRVHAQAKGHPLAMDDRYGDPEFNKEMHHLGLKRMFLHAHSIEFTLPTEQQHISVKAPLDVDLTQFLTKLDREGG